MTKSRYDYKSFAPSDRPRWLVAMSMWREPIECERLEPKTDLRPLFVAMVERYRAEGWKIEKEPDQYATLFVNRDGERRMLALFQVEPASR